MPARRTINHKHLTNNTTVSCQLSVVNCQWGFTLVEFLVVLGLLALTMGSTLVFLTSVLKGSNQANVTAEVKQNGQAVLDSLERQIRNATDSQSDLTGKYIKLIRPDAEPLHIKCFSDWFLPKSENGWIGGVVSNATPPDSSYDKMTNVDKISGVDIQSCNFAVLPSSLGAASPPIVSIDFVVNQGINAPSRQDFLANVRFRTTISLRKY